MAAPSVVRNDTTVDDPNFIHANRVIGKLADGTVLVATYDDSANNIHIYHSSDRSTWTLVVTIASAVTSVFSMAMEVNGNFQVVYQTNASYQNLVWARYAKGAGYTWSISGAAENVVTTHADRTIQHADIDVLGVSVAACCVVWREKNLDAASPTEQRIVARARGTGATWSTEQYVFKVDDANNQGLENDTVFCSADPAGIVASNQGVLCGGATTRSGSGQNVHLARLLFNATTGAFVSTVTGGNAFSSIGSHSNVATVVSESRMSVFPVGSGEWYLVAAWYNLVDTSHSLYITHCVWNGTSIALEARASSTITGAATGRPAMARLANGRIVVFRPWYNRTGQGGMFGYTYEYGVAANVWDPATNIWSGSFRFTELTYAKQGLVGSGAHQNLDNNADVVHYVNADADTYFDYNQTVPAPSVPTNPANGSTISTDVPTLQGIPATLLQAGIKKKMTWQVANDSGFTSNVKTVTESDADLSTSSSVRSEVVPTGSQLSQGTRYIRQATIDAFGRQGAYSSHNQFTVSHPPSATGLTPNSGVLRDFGGTGQVTLDWTFSDTSPVDTQTAYQVVVERNSDGVVLLDTGKTVSTNTAHVGTIAAGDKDTLLRWKVRLWDSDDVVGSYSGYATFMIGDKPTISITAPAHGGTANNPAPTVTWTFGGSGGRTQSEYRVALWETATPSVLVYDSGWVPSSTASHGIPSPVLTNTIAYTVQVEVQDSGGLTNLDTNNFTASWTPPAQPAETVDATGYSTNGYVNVTWTNASQDASYLMYRVYRRRVGTTAWILVHETSAVSPTYQFKDWLVSSNEQWEWVVVQVALRFGVAVESAYAGPSAATPVSEDYWLIHPSDETLNMRLNIVTADNFKEETEQAVINLIGRGRRVEYGTEWGHSGSLTAQVYDDATKTARAKRLLLELLKAERREVYLRKPFGDVWLVNIGDMDISLMAGVGQREFHTLTLPYQEVV